MYTIRTFKRVESLEEAYELNQKKTTTILGGGMWLRLGNRQIQAAVDLSGLGLDTIEETDDAFVIGCMTPLRDMEVHPGLNRYFQDMIRDCLKDIVGVQFRNTATIGGSLYGRFGFSDPLTALLVLDTTVEMYKGGMIPLEDFVDMPYDRDILVRVHIRKDGRRCAYQSFRNTRTDFPVLTAAVSSKDGIWRAAVGARPKKAALIAGAAKLPERPEKKDVGALAKEARDTLKYEDNMRASADYRKILTGVLLERAVEAVCGGMDHED